MARSISKGNTEKVSTSMPLGKPPTGDKSLILEPTTHFYEIEDSDNTEEGEEAEIFVIHDKSLTSTKQRPI